MEITLPNTTESAQREAAGIASLGTFFQGELKQYQARLANAVAREDKNEIQHCQHAIQSIQERQLLFMEKASALLASVLYEVWREGRERNLETRTDTNWITKNGDTEINTTSASYNDLPPDIQEQFLTPATVVVGHMVTQEPVDLTDPEARQEVAERLYTHNFEHTYGVSCGNTVSLHQEQIDAVRRLETAQALFNSPPQQQ